MTRFNAGELFTCGFPIRRARGIRLRRRIRCRPWPPSIRSRGTALGRNASCTKLAEQLVVLATNVLLRCETVAPSERLTILALIDALASVGNMHASNAARLFAERIREGG